MRNAESLARIEFFRSLDADSIAALDTQCSWKRVPAGEALVDFQDPHPSNDVFFIVSGTARITIRSAGRDVLLRQLETGDFFGLLVAVDTMTPAASVIAVTNVSLARMPATVFRTVIRTNEDVCDKLLDALVDQIRSLVSRVHELSTLDVRYRVYAELLRLSRLEPNRTGRAIVSPPPPHAEIAARVGTRRESVARELKALERAGLMERRRGAIVLTDTDQLRRLVKEAEQD